MEFKLHFMMEIDKVTTTTTTKTSTNYELVGNKLWLVCAANSSEFWYSLWCLNRKIFNTRFPVQMYRENCILAKNCPKPHIDWIFVLKYEREFFIYLKFECNFEWQTYPPTCQLWQITSWECDTDSTDPVFGLQWLQKMSPQLLRSNLCKRSGEIVGW